MSWNFSKNRSLSKNVLQSIKDDENVQKTGFFLRKELRLRFLGWRNETEDNRHEMNVKVAKYAIWITGLRNFSSGKKLQEIGIWIAELRSLSRIR